jgi:DNA-binding NarL/FixJ family response regulator
MSRTVLIADDSELIRRSIRRVLAEEPSIHVIGEAVNFADAIDRARDLQPDVPLLDLHMPDDKVIEAAQIKANLSDSRVEDPCIPYPLICAWRQRFRLAPR